MSAAGQSTLGVAFETHCSRCPSPAAFFERNMPSSAIADYRQGMTFNLIQNMRGGSGLFRGVISSAAENWEMSRLGIQ